MNGVCQNKTVKHQEHLTMNSLDTEHIKKMVAELDAAVPREGARVHLSQYGGGPDESKVVANQRGYLRLGIEFLRAAFAPPSPKSKNMIDADLRYMLTEDSTVGFDWFERREELSTPRNYDSPPPSSSPQPSSRYVSFGVVLAIIGLGAVVRLVDHAVVRHCLPSGCRRRRMVRLGVRPCSGPRRT